MKPRNEGENFDRSEFGYPILPAQAAVGLFRMVDDASGEVVAETLVLPNAIFHFDVRRNGALIGESLMTDPDGARIFSEQYMPGRCEEITECECRHHDGKSMEVLDPDIEFPRG